MSYYLKTETALETVASPKTLTPDFCVYYPGLRFYKPSIGKWTSRDPIGEEGGENLYGFVKNKPVGFYDALGKILEDVVEVKGSVRAPSKSYIESGDGVLNLADKCCYCYKHKIWTQDIPPDYETWEVSVLDSIITAKNQPDCWNKCLKKVKFKFQPSWPPPVREAGAKYSHMHSP